jgi:hypothetical protein
MTGLYALISECAESTKAVYRRDCSAPGSDKADVPPMGARSEH